MTVLLSGDDWAADHHDVELMDPAGMVLARARLSEGAAGMARLHALVGEHSPGTFHLDPLPYGYGHTGGRRGGHVQSAGHHRP